VVALVQSHYQSADRRLVTDKKKKMELISLVLIETTAIVLAHYTVIGIDYVVDVVKSKLR